MVIDLTNRRPASAAGKHCHSAGETIVGGRCRPAEKKPPHAQRWIGNSAALLLALCAVFAATRACAELFTVTTTADSGPGSLRDAIMKVNNTPGGNVIYTRIPCPSGEGSPVITLVTPLPTVLGTISMSGINLPCAKVCLDGSQLPSGSHGLRFVASGPQQVVDVVANVEAAAFRSQK